MTSIVKQVHARSLWSFVTQGTLAQVKPEEAVEVLTMICKNWTFAQYMCPGNVVCLIGRISLKTKKRESTLMEMLGDTCLSQTKLYPGGATPTDPAFYETDVNHRELKVDSVTLLQGPWSDITNGLIMPLYVKRMVDSGMWPWQRQVMESLDNPDERSVNFVVDNGGKRGKSSLGMFLLCNGLGRRLPPCLSYKDVMRKVMDTPTMKCYIVDLPRTIKPWKIIDIFSAVEEIKNGHAWDDRYQWKEKTFEPPVIWMFANSLPDLSMLSSDRWKVWKMQEHANALEPYYGELPVPHPTPVLQIACAGSADSSSPTAATAKRPSSTAFATPIEPRSVVARTAEESTALTALAQEIRRDTGPTTEEEWAAVMKLETDWGKE